MPSPQGPALAPEMEVLSCSCGYLLTISLIPGEAELNCPGCHRDFKIRVAKDARTGKPVLDAMFTDDNNANATTHIGAGKATEILASARTQVDDEEEENPENSATATSFELLLNNTPMAKGALDDAIVPDPPSKLPFTCACKRKHTIGRSSYDKRVKCGPCGATMLLSVVFDAGTRRHCIVPIRVLT